MSRINYLFRVVPDELQARYGARGDRMSVDAWDIGDDANELWDMAVTLKWKVWKMDVYEFIAAAHNYVVSGRTVRDDAAIAEFFEQEIRDQYDVLTFNHFRIAKTFGDQWQTILDGALRYIDDHGKLPSGEWLSAHYRGVKQAPIVADIDTQTQELNEYRSMVENDYVDEPGQGEMVNGQTNEVIELTYKQHAMVSGLARTIRFLQWASKRLPDLGVTSHLFDTAVENLQVAIASITDQLLTKDRTSSRM